MIFAHPFPQRSFWLRYLSHTIYANVRIIWIDVRFSVRLLNLLTGTGPGQGYHGCHSVAYNRFYLSVSPLFAFSSFTLVYARCLPHPQPRNTKSVGCGLYIFVNIINTRTIILVNMTDFRFLVSNCKNVTLHRQSMLAFVKIKEWIYE